MRLKAGCLKGGNPVHPSGSKGKTNPLNMTMLQIGNTTDFHQGCLMADKTH